MIGQTAGKSKAKLSAEEKERQNKKISFESVLAQNQSGNLRSVRKNAVNDKFRSRAFQAKLKEKIKSQSSADKKEDSEKQGSEKQGSEPLRIAQWLRICVFKEMIETKSYLGMRLEIDSEKTVSDIQTAWQANDETLRFTCMSNEGCLLLPYYYS